MNISLNCRTFSFIILFFLASCNLSVATYKTVPTVSVGIATKNGRNASSTTESTFVPKMQLTSMVGPKLSVTSDLTMAQGSSLTRTVIFIPSATLTPHPIRELSDAEKLKMMDLLNYTGDCKLPCWNGITPGFSRIEEAQGFFARLGYDIGPWPPKEDEKEGHMEVKLVGFPLGSLSYSYFYISLQWENRNR